MEHIQQYVNLVLTTLTLVFAFGVWKGRKDFSSDELLKKAEEVKKDLETYRERHHRQLEALQVTMGNLLTKTETDRLMRQHDTEHERIWKEIDELSRKVDELILIVPLRKEYRNAKKP